ncbi:ATP-binding protein [Sphingomonas sp. C3-2]|uniref:ATP-binding protein n=1 Tax=Sphingomonas sp. C3-2 TaxID=3062169 RepID=UPI00294AAE6F|nr:ATP-binding protein [Sphingomonas sp. C3-2]WOK37317.1 ATP-binding protein [Sphingomonas sp. C3-2]
MKLLDSPWTTTAVVIVILAAGVGWGVGGNWESALVTLLGGMAAILIAQYPFKFENDNTTPILNAEESAGRARVKVIEALNDPALIIRRGRIIIANPAALALFGNHIMGEDVRVAIRHPAAAEHLMASTLPRDDRGIELVGLGSLDQHWLMRVVDIGDERRLVHLIDRSEAYVAERMRVDFVANASHELRTPLAGIIGFIETLDEPEAGSDAGTRKRFLGVMMKEARRMQTLVDDLISLSRIEADKYRAPDDAVDLVPLVQEVSRVTKDRPGADQREILVEIDEKTPPVAGDRAQLSQLLHNIVGNAFKYGRPGTPIRISMAGNGNAMVRLSVEDEGEGIAPHHIPRLTERFYRVDSGRSRSLGGTGLGLSIVKHIVERHRGKLDIASISGKGTTVTVTLPAASERMS